MTNFPPRRFVIQFRCEAAMDGSMMVSLGLVCALRWSEVFKSDGMTRNDLDDFSKDPGSYSRRIRRRSFCVAFFYQVPENEKDRLCAKSARGSTAEVPRVVNLQHCSVEPLERW